MKNLFFRLPEHMRPSAGNAFLGTALLALAHFAVAPYYLNLFKTTGISQFGTLVAITSALGIIFVLTAMLSWRGHHDTGMVVALSVLSLSYPFISAFLVRGLGTVLGLALMFGGPIMALQSLSKKPGMIATIVTLLAGAITILLDQFGSAARPSLSGLLIQGVALAVVIILGLALSGQFGRARIQTRLTLLVVVVTVPLLVGVTAFISSRAGQVIEEHVNRDLEESNDALAANVSSWLEQQTETLHEMAALPEIASMNSGRQRPTLQVIAAAHSNLFLVQTTDLNGINVARNDDNEMKDYHDRGWFLGAKSGAPITIEALISRTTGKPALNFSTPIRDQFGKIVGVASVVSQLDQISREVLEAEEGRGMLFIVDASNHVVAHPDPTYTTEELRDLSAYPPVAALRNGRTGLITFTDENGEVWRAYISALDNGWGIIAQQPEAELLVPVHQFRRLAILLMVIGTSVMLGLAWFTIRRTLRPIGTLTETVSAIAAGDLNRVAKVESQDEIGILSSSFNQMTTQLRELIGTLESRVAERTQRLGLAAEVGRAISQVRDLDVMLKDACELILKEFDLYYVQVYLADPSQTTLRLEAGTGTVGAQLVERRHSLPLDSNSINGRAALTKHTVVIADTAQSDTFRKNPLLPETRGEMAVPLTVADKTVGVLDMQSNQPDVLTEEVLPAFEALAGQLAVAIQNAALLAQAEQAREEVEKQARRLARTAWNEHLDAIHKPEQVGYVFDRNQVTSLTNSDKSQFFENGNSIAAPISVTGETLGSLVVELESQSQPEQTDDLVNIVARQISQQIENLRLLESAERYRYEAEQAARLQTVEGWQEYVGSRDAASLGYLYDTKVVRPQGDAEVQELTAFALPLKARDEMIGQVSVQGLTAEDQDAVELVNVVSERLGSHLESLRLFEETRRGQVELDKRARQLAAVADVSSVSSRELDIQKMLETVVYLTQRKFGLYHAHIFIYNEQSDLLKIAACGWKEGDEHEGTHGTAQIPVNQEQSLVARAARTRQAVIVNDVHNEPGWLPNPLLPDSAAELAVPLIIGEKLLGVLDVQSDKIDVFTSEDANIYSTLASQIATALQNANSFAQAQQQAERESRLNVISQKIQSATTVEAVLQIAARELGHTLGAPLTIAQLGLKETASGN